MILPNGAIVAVLDGEKMRILRNKGHEPRIELIELPAPNLEEVSGGSGGRHRSSTANPDIARLAEDDFAAAAAAYLNREALAGSFQHVVIVADPRTLGELRRHFHPTLSGKLVGQIDRDLAKHSAEAIKTAIVAA
ncbi:host cell attachment protein [Paramesorhizobium deserti]|uniref:Host cell attachment protein n=1 Tax=Paramesorhizobium deserti TaxID=1494590 RepID=A0A135HRN3_9HYPH|nr:host attachment protein [Paramesorhizobium deserti]KXF75856.1 host cell attachment protein [Paramesorhizobium deserti]